MPRHAVSPISIQTEPGRAKRLAQLGLVLVAQRSPDGLESRIWESLTWAIEGDQPRHIERALVHAAAFLFPGDRLHEALEQLVRSPHPVAMQLDPGVVAQKSPSLTGEDRREGEWGPVVQQGGLEVDQHPPILAGTTNTCSSSQGAGEGRRLIGYRARSGCRAERPSTTSEPLGPRGPPRACLQRVTPGTGVSDALDPGDQ